MSQPERMMSLSLTASDGIGSDPAGFTIIDLLTSKVTANSLNKEPDSK